MTRKDDGDGGTKPPYYGVRIRPLRVEDELWEDFGKATESRGETRAGVLRECMRRYIKRHGTE